MCVRPLKGFVIGKTEKGKDLYKIVPYKTDHVEKVKGKWIICESSFSSPYAEKCVTAFTEIPCGKCVDCRLKYSRQWADRCMFELGYYKPSECWFLTITYDEEHIMDVGSNVFYGTLEKHELSNFLKRLRRHCEYHEINNNIRFYACGEYGSKTHRPHYHMILYGLDLLKNDSMKYWNKSKTGHVLYRSPLLEKIWKKGMVVVAPVSWDTCAYTARYVMKKIDGLTPDHYISNGVEPEFVLMSRKPGIGRWYFDDNYEKIYEHDEIIYSSPDKGRKTRPPKYFDTLYENLFPSKMADVKARRRECSETLRELKLSRTGLSFEDVLQIEEEVLRKKNNLLKRS